jgi:hypothetical protein
MELVSDQSFVQTDLQIPGVMHASRACQALKKLVAIRAG